ncbi:MAG: ABC transporter ATP-binding protein [Lachnospiraceae bacterium]
MIQIKDLNKKFIVRGEEMPVLENINMDVGQGEFISIVGHSGCGKSTLLKMIAGLESCEEGSIDYTGGEKTSRMIFQDHRLLPWLTIKDNIGLALYGLGKQEKEELIREHIHFVHLDGFEEAYPHQLSGGMAQRAAIARALICKPDILLLDEPFGALDALTRIEMQKEVLRIWEKEKMTMILVTHDIDEAIYLGDRVLVFSNRPGKIRQEISIDLPRERVRTSVHFANFKERIYEQFFEDRGTEIQDYSI